MLAFAFFRWSSFTKTSSSFNIDLHNEQINIIYHHKTNSYTHAFLPALTLTHSLFWFLYLFRICLDLSALEFSWSPTSGPLGMSSSTSLFFHHHFSFSHPPHFPFNINNIVHFVSVKMENTNFLLWKFQFLVILQTHNLVGSIDGSLPYPPQFLKVDGKSSLNLDYTLWVKQDQQWVSLIMATLSKPLLGRVVDPSYTSFSIWSKLESHFASSSKLQIIQLQSQLQTIKKGATPIAEYVNTLRTLANQLASLSPSNQGYLQTSGQGHGRGRGQG